MQNIFLKPGKLAYSTEPSEITTVLGSCVAICIWDRVKRVGGMCHYYLPESQAGESKRDEENSYGAFAIKNLLRKFKQNGSQRGDLEAKVLGGSDVIEVRFEGQGSVGAHNIAIAREILGSLRIPIVAKSIGGNKGRKLRFNTATGRVHYQTLAKTEVAAAPVPTKGRPFKVLVVDDSRSIREILTRMIESDSEFKVIGRACDAFEAQDMIKKERPDIITLDIRMPKMDGISFLESYIKSDFIPTIMITALTEEDSDAIFRALEMGAFHYLKKPHLSDIDSLSSELHQILRAAIKRGANSKFKAICHSYAKDVLPLASSSYPSVEDALILMGASTGGTEALKEILTKLPREIPPILVVQHIPAPFAVAFAARLDELCCPKVQIATDGMKMLAGNIYVAPGGFQMGVSAQGSGKLIIKITDDPPLNRFKPSVDYLFEAATRVNVKKIVAILLTGMGDDGARGMKALRKMGATTIAQDEKTSAVYGMPKVAFELGAVDKVAALDDIPKFLFAALKKTEGSF